MRSLLVAITIVLLAGTARADLRVAFHNDIFAHLNGKDDDGFTNDLDVRFWRPYREYLIGGRLFDRWVTEEPRVAGGRRDLVELLATGERSWTNVGPARSITAGARVGPVFTGNLGGRWMQDKFHIACGCGSPLTEGLQNRYVGDGDAGMLLGGGGRASFGLQWVQGYGVVDGQAAVGTGVAFIDGAAGVNLVGRYLRTQFGAHFELALMRFHTVDDRGLGIPGGYRPGFQTGYRVGGFVARGWFRIEYELHSNEGGSGSPMGLVALTFKQSGTSF